MSKNKNYGGYFKPKKEEPINEPSTSPEEIQTPEKAAEAPKEEAQVEETKVEEPKNIGAIPAKVCGAKRVNMRADMSKDAPVKTVLEEGTTVYILERSSDGVWSKISLGLNDIGFMMSQFLKED